MKKHKYILLGIGSFIVIGAVLTIVTFTSGSNEEEKNDKINVGEIESIQIEDSSLRNEIENEEAETQETETQETEVFGNGQYLKDIDWDSVAARVSEEEAKALQKYQSVLEGESFVWIYRTDEKDETDTYVHEQKQLTIQGMTDEYFRLNEMEPKDAVVDSFLFADVFQTGEKNICVLFRYFGYNWLILHEDNGVVYGIDMPVRWFQGVQKDGLYYGSGGAGVSYYHRMSFENGDYVEENIGDVIYGEFFIDDVKQSETVYQKWIEDNIKEQVQWYEPVE